jgi:virginiamycin B lyase
MRARAAFTAAAALLALAGPADARPPVLHQAPVARGGGTLEAAIDVGPDGAVWFTVGDGVVRRVGAGGRPEEVARLGDREYPYSLVAGPDGNSWLTLRGAIVRVSPTGEVTRFSDGLSPGAVPMGMARGPDGNLWFTEYAAFDKSDPGPVPGGIGRITPDGQITEFAEDPDDNHGYSEIAAGPDGAMWFTMDNLDEQGIGRITTDGAVTEFRHGFSPGLLGELTAGPHGRVWFTNDGIESIGRHGRVRRYRVPRPHFTVMGSSTRGPDGALGSPSSTAAGSAG